MRRLVLLSLLVLLLFPSMGSAVQFASNTVVIPIIGRFPGAFGSAWRTDVFVANPYNPAVNATATFYVAGGPTLTTTMSIPEYGAVSLPDIVQNTFGLANASGQLVVTGDHAIEARARIYNVGSPAGQFGQNVPGLAAETLRRQAFVYGLSGSSGNRINVGVANPNSFDVTVVLYVADKDNRQLYLESMNVPPHQTLQFNDIVARYSIPPQDGIQVSFSAANSAWIFYGYASEVRNDSGDAVFLFGTAPNS